MEEIKELYSEELALLKRIQEYGKEHTCGVLKRVENVKFLLLYRFFSNLYSALLLTATALKKRKIAFYQLPIGIILRCCFTDSLFALYIQRISEEDAYKELDLRDIEYANSLLERKEVYRDQVKSIGEDFDDAFIDNMWKLTMEDNFLGLLSFDENVNDLAVTKQTKKQLKDCGYLKTKSIATKDILDYLVKIPELKAIAMRLYHYYRYFSQYEHFSENGQGDVLVSEKVDGNDNIHLPSAIRALSAGVEVIMREGKRDMRPE